MDRKMVIVHNQALIVKLTGKTLSQRSPKCMLHFLTIKVQQKRYFRSQVLTNIEFRLVNWKQLQELIFLQRIEQILIKSPHKTKRS